MKRQYLLFQLLNTFFLLLHLSITSAQNESYQLGVTVGHSESINSVSFSEDGMYFATTSESSLTIKIWETNTGRLIKTITTPANEDSFDNYRNVKISPTNDYVFASSNYNNYHIWDLKKNKKIFDSKKHNINTNWKYGLNVFGITPALSPPTKYNPKGWENIIDACHSGEVDKEEVETISKVKNLKEGSKGSIVVKA